MNTLKKISFIMLSIVLLLAFSSGCNVTPNASGSSGPVTVTIWHYYTSELESSFNDLIQEFNNTYGKENDIIVNAVNQEDIDTLTNKVIQSGKNDTGSDELPDIIFAYTGTVLELDHLGLIANLDNYFSSDELSRYYPSFIEEGRIGSQNELMSFPVAKSTELLFINENDLNQFLDSANTSGAYPAVSKDDFSTFEGIAHLSDVYYQWTDDKTPAIPNDGKSFFGMDASSNFISVGLRQLGNTPVSVSDETGTFTMDKAAAKQLWDFYYANMVTGRFAEIGRYRSDDMKTGDLVAYLGSSGGATYFPEEIMSDSNTTEKTKMLVLPYPVFKGGKSVSIQQGAGMSVIKSNQQSESAAASFIKWFTSPEQNVRFSYLSGYLPVQKEEFTKSVQEKVLAELENNADAKQQNALAALKVASRQFASYELSVDKEYIGSFDVRNMFGTTMSEAAKASRSALLSDLAGGSTLTQALPTYLDNTYFENWFSEIQKQFDELTGQ